MTAHRPLFDNDAQKQPLRIVQLSDLHLFPHPWQRLEWGDRTPVNPEAQLNGVLDAIRDLERIDAIIVTGDLAQEPVWQTYQRLPGFFEKLPPTFFLPGNHDDRWLFNQAVQENLFKRLTRIRMGNWLVLGVDSCVDGEDWGYLSHTAMLALERQLAQAGSLNVVIALHHPPMDCGMPWLDRIGLRNGESFMRTIKAWKNVKGILSGHVHHAFEHKLGELKVLGCPSTTVQFVNENEGSRYRVEKAGFNLLTLHHNGRLDCETRYLSGIGAEDKRSA